MGPTVSTLWFVDTPDPAAVLRGRPVSDADAARALVRRLHPEFDAVALPSGPLGAAAAPPARQVHIGCYPGVTVVCGAGLAIDTPSTIDESWVRSSAAERTYLVCAENATPWGAFAFWERGELRRSFSATSAFIHENVGLPLVWEREYWGGEHRPPHPVDTFPDPLSLPFHPGDFADAANAAWLGFRHGDPNAPGPTVCGFALYPPGEAPAPYPDAAAPQHGLRSWWQRLTARAAARSPHPDE